MAAPIDMKSSCPSVACYVSSRPASLFTSWTLARFPKPSIPSSGTSMKSETGLGDIDPEDVQRSAKRLVRGCENFVPALAYLFGLPLPGSCLARFAHFLAGLCTVTLNVRVSWSSLEKAPHPWMSPLRVRVHCPICVPCQEAH